jgi:hypothetical protein
VTRRTARAIAALADGTLPVNRREALLTRVTRSAELSRALEQQLLTVAIVRSLADSAPASLRALVDGAGTRE